MGILLLVILETLGPEEGTSWMGELGRQASQSWFGDLPMEEDSPLSGWHTPLAPSAQPDPEFGIRLAPVARYLSGHVTVGENTIQGTKLDLGRDLGLDKAVGADLDFRSEGASLRFDMEVEDLYGFGTHSERRPFNWNGASFSPPAQVRSASNLLTVLPLLTWKAIQVPEDGVWVGPVIGLEYPYYTVTVSTSRAKGSLEDWVHFLPYPTLGLAGGVEISDRLRIEPRVTASYWPNMAVPYTEGGTLYVSARPSVRLELPLVWRVGAAFELSAGVTYQYWSGRDHSTEDGNTLTLSSPGIWLGLGYRW